MRLKAIYTQGKLWFAEPVRLRSNRVRLLVEVPDEEVIPVSRTGGETAPPATRERLNAILGRFRSTGGDSGYAQYKALWRAHLEDKYLDSR